MSSLKNLRRHCSGSDPSLECCPQHIIAMDNLYTDKYGFVLSKTTLERIAAGDSPIYDVIPGLKKEPQPETAAAATDDQIPASQSIRNAVVTSASSVAGTVSAGALAQPSIRNAVVCPKV